MKIITFLLIAVMFNEISGDIKKHWEVFKVIYLFCICQMCKYNIIYSINTFLDYDTTQLEFISILEEKSVYSNINWLQRTNKRRSNKRLNQKVRLHKCFLFTLTGKFLAFCAILVNLIILYTAFSPQQLLELAEIN